ncbi:MAG TPA: hypothetical protein VGO02_06095 [Burkholderiales bacterium]|jgi:hypothetical protein|nr:hypothetical protein [Burkholderiales bacterium]
MRTSSLILGGAFALLVSLPAPAQDKDKQPSASPAAGASGSAGAGSSAARRSVPLQANQTRKQLFDKLDSNGNGSISRAEAQQSPALVIIFVETDSNSDGELSAAEFDKVPLVNSDGTPAP